MGRFGSCKLHVCSFATSIDDNAMNVAAPALLLPKQSVRYRHGCRVYGTCRSSGGYITSSSNSASFHSLSFNCTCTHPLSRIVQNRPFCIRFSWASLSAFHKPQTSIATIYRPWVLLPAGTAALSCVTRDKGAVLEGHGNLRVAGKGAELG